MLPSSWFQTGRDIGHQLHVGRFQRRINAVVASSGGATRYAIGSPSVIPALMRDKNRYAKLHVPGRLCFRVISPLESRAIFNMRNHRIQPARTSAGFGPPSIISTSPAVVTVRVRLPHTASGHTPLPPCLFGRFISRNVGDVIGISRNSPRLRICGGNFSSRANSALTRQSPAWRLPTVESNLKLA